VQKSKQIKTVKLAKNVKITQEQLSMRQPPAAPPRPCCAYYAESSSSESFDFLVDFAVGKVGKRCIRLGGLHELLNRPVYIHL